MRVLFDGYERGLLQTSLALVLLSVPQTDGFGHHNVKRRVQTASVTRTYKFVLNRLEVFELPDNRVRISFLGVWPNSRKREETRNTLSGRTATMKLGEGDDACLITLDFKANKVVARSDGSILQCGFGFNIEVDGTYVKISSKPPSFH